jgi:hypothetical protein
MSRPINDADDGARSAQRVDAPIERIAENEPAEPQAHDRADEHADLIVGLAGADEELEHGFEHGSLDPVGWRTQSLRREGLAQRKSMPLNTCASDAGGHALRLRASPASLRRGYLSPALIGKNGGGLETSQGDTG